MDGNTELIGFIQRAIGYSLTGNVSEQCLFFLHGEGANGKSTFLNVIKEMCGDYAIQCPADTLMMKREQGISNDVARLRGSRFVATSETEEGQPLAEAKVKQLTGGDPIVARFLYGELFEFTPNFKIWLAANHKPIIRGGDHAIWRRIKLIPFNVTFFAREMDHTLPERLRSEYPGIFAWAVAGCREWHQHGLKPPKEITEATRQYKEEMDLLEQWIDSCCVQASDATGKSSELHRSYSQFVQDAGGQPENTTNFGRKLAQRGFEKTKKGTIVYSGIGLR
jgi:putative DNA primase/helicase